MPEVAQAIVTVSPDVASSTNLGGWINRVGVWNPRHERAADAPAALKWEERPTGRHIELGISETNLMLLLGQLGLSRDLSGHRLIPIGTVYDPFVCRGLDALIHALYQESRFILVGTPSGVTLSPEGGAHQSVITPSIGLELPGVVAYEPCFAQELNWILEGAIHDLDNDAERSYYLRLSTRAVDQDLLPVPPEGEERERLRRQVLDGCHRVRAHQHGGERVDIFAVGTVVPEALHAAEVLADEGVSAGVFSVTSADLLFRRLQQRTITHVRESRHVPGPADVLERGERGIPVVTVVDGHPHTLAFIGSALGSASACLGVHAFGQSGSREAVYSHAGIDSGSIVNAAIGLVDAERR
jgi:pyruvate dehydrogenase E1 component